MATSSTNGVIELLEKFLKILKEEQVFDETRSFIPMLHSKDLQVNNSLIFYVNS